MLSPPGRLVDLGEHRLHLLERGERGPSVVFETGNGGSVLDWALVQPALAGEARTVAYDRAGCGWSDRGPRPRTCAEMVEELRALLRAAGVEPPHVLVGWSFGGFVARTFAALHPGEVAGLVLLDVPPLDLVAPEPDREALVAPYLRAREARARSLATFERLARFGVLRWLSRLLVPREMPADLRALAGEIATRPERFAIAREEIAGLAQGARELRGRALRSDLPLRVVAAARSIGGFEPAQVGRGEAADAVQRLSLDGQRALAGESTQGAFREVNGGHVIAMEHPEAAIAAIREVLALIA